MNANTLRENKLAPRYSPVEFCEWLFKDAKVALPYQADWQAKRERDYRRYKTAIIVSDLQDVEGLPLRLRALIYTAKELQPDLICFAGNVVGDLSTKYIPAPPNKRYPDQEQMTVYPMLERLRFVGDCIFRPIRHVCPNTQLDWIEGRNDLHLRSKEAFFRHTKDAIPSNITDHRTYRVNYISRVPFDVLGSSPPDLSSRDNFKVYWETYIVYMGRMGHMMGLNGVQPCTYYEKPESRGLLCDQMLYNAIHDATNPNRFNDLTWIFNWGDEHSYLHHMKWKPYHWDSIGYTGFLIANIDTQTHITKTHYVDTIIPDYDTTQAAS